ncbi:MBL fold metallo-hydrolase [Sphingomonas sp. RRHST34]|uniref:MBL fold metallo-hydrolase n=1 Tax=Sphingomonas citri TaxID=2862499 RepID=A0ABS7BT24_9SPHN|nr:MBL fold metallo-hydrolase [Sphingomonas citri]MBW6532632.1 MBL fold metallo-hydrolase [Sphingomonas citri]
MMIRPTSLLLAGMLAMLLVGCASTKGKAPAPLYAGPPSPHFDGREFFNPEDKTALANPGGGRMQDGEILSLIKHRGKWPRSVPINRSVPAPRVDGDQLRVTWIGHATTLVQTQGLNILIDPVWAHFNSPIQVRVRPRPRGPGVRLEDLPKIDLVLISHTHIDHLDMQALRYIYDRDKTQIIGGLGIDNLLRRNGMKAIGGEWGQTIPIKTGVDVVVNRAHHWSGRWINDHNLVLWAGYTIVLPGGNIYYAGDTGPGDWAWVADALRARPIRLAILPIGPTHVHSRQPESHITAPQAEALWEKLGMPFALGVHWGTIEMTDQEINGSPDMVHLLIKKHGRPQDRFRTIEAGDSWDVGSTIQEPRPADETCCELDVDNSPLSR